MTIDDPKVRKLYPKNARLNADTVLDRSINEFEDVLVIGYTKDGHFEMRASENVNPMNGLWLLESARRYLFDAVEGVSSVQVDD